MHTPTSYSGAPKICIYCDVWAQGGIETFIANYLTHTEATDLRYTVVCSEKRASRLDSRLAERGFSVRPMQDEADIGAAKHTLKSFFPLLRLCRDERFDIVHLNIFNAFSFLLVLAAKLGGAKNVIVHAHGSGLRKSRGYLVKYLVHYFFCLLFYFGRFQRWAASEKAAGFLFLNRKATIICNGIDAKSFRFDPSTRDAVRKSYGIGERRVMACVGRMDSQKNQAFTLELLSELIKRDPTYYLLLIGDGEDRAALEKMASKLHLDGFVCFCGVCDHVNRLLSAADLLLIPSFSEGLSITAIEGQAAGLPVICSDGVPAEVRLCDSLKFIPLKEKEAWLNEIEHALTPDRILCNDIVKSGKFDIGKSAESINDHYRSICF